MTPVELEKWTQKNLEVDGNAVVCSFKTMPIVKWNSWRCNGNHDVESFLGSQLPKTTDSHQSMCGTVIEDELETMGHQVQTEYDS